MPWRLHVTGICCVTFDSDAVGLYTWRSSTIHCQWCYYWCLYLVGL